MSNQTKSYIYALAAVLCWSTVASAFKITLQFMDFEQLLLLSSFIAFLTIFIINLKITKLSRVIMYTPKQWLQSVLLGFLNPFLYYLILFKAYSLIPAQEALTLNYIWVVMVVLFSIPVLKQKISLKSFICILISFIGVIIVATHGDLFSLKFSNLSGTLLALGSSLVWALFWLLNVKDKREASLKLLLNFFFGFLFILIIHIANNDIINTNWKGLLGATYIGIFEMGLTFYLWLKALSLSSTTDKISSLIFISPVLSLIFISIFVGETITISTLIGLVLILLGIILQKITNKK